MTRKSISSSRISTSHLSGMFEGLVHSHVVGGGVDPEVGPGVGGGLGITLHVLGAYGLGAWQIRGQS